VPLVFLGEFGVVYKGHIVKDLGRTVTEVVAIKTLKGLCHRNNNIIIMINSFDYYVQQEKLTIKSLKIFRIL
jgi:hypothetical protein